MSGMSSSYQNVFGVAKVVLNMVVVNGERLVRSVHFYSTDGSTTPFVETMLHGDVSQDADSMPTLQLCYQQPKRAKHQLQASPEQLRGEACAGCNVLVKADPDEGVVWCPACEPNDGPPADGGVQYDHQQDDALPWAVRPPSSKES